MARVGFREGCLPFCCLARLALWKLIGRSQTGFRIGLKPFDFITESMFTFIPDHCSGIILDWRSVHHPDTAYVS